MLRYGLKRLKLAREVVLLWLSHPMPQFLKPGKKNHFSPSLSEARGDLRVAVRFGADVFIILPLHRAALNLSPYKVIF